MFDNPRYIMYFVLCREDVNLTATDSCPFPTIPLRQYLPSIRLMYPTYTSRKQFVTRLTILDQCYDQSTIVVVSVVVALRVLLWVAVVVGVAARQISLCASIISVISISPCLCGASQSLWTNNLIVFKLS